MIKSLQSLGQTQHIQIVLAYEGDTVSATVFLTPKGSKKDELRPPLHVTGTVAEVQDYVTSGRLGAEASEVVAITSSIEELRKQKAEAEKQKASAERAASDAEIRAGAAKAKAKGKETKPAPAEPAKQTVPLAEVKPAYKAAPKAETPAPATPAPDDALFAELQAIAEEGQQQ
jgi:PRTRC genetic system protein E